MRVRLASVAVVLSVLATPAVAAAKDVSEVSVCGAGGKCTTYDKSDFKSLTFLANDAGPTDPPGAAAPWYRVRFTVDQREHGGGYARWTVAYVPSADRLRVRNDDGSFAWVEMNPRAARVFARAARSLPPLPTARLSGVAVKSPQARVVEVVTPPTETVTSHAGTTPWGWILAAALAATAVLGSVARMLRRPERWASRRVEPS